MPPPAPVHSYLPPQAQNFMIAVLCFASVLLPTVGIVAVWALNSDARAVMMGGLVADIITVA